MQFKPEAASFTTKDPAALWAALEESGPALCRIKLHTEALSGDLWISNGTHIVWASTPASKGSPALLSLLKNPPIKFELVIGEGVPYHFRDVLRISLVAALNERTAILKDLEQQAAREASAVLVEPQPAPNEPKTYGKTYLRDELQLERKEAEDILARLLSIIESQPNIIPDDEEIPITADELLPTDEEQRRHFYFDAEDYLHSKVQSLVKQRLHMLNVPAGTETRELIDRESELGPDPDSTSGYTGKVRKNKKVTQEMIIAAVMIVIGLPIFILSANSQHERATAELAYDRASINLAADNSIAMQSGAYKTQQPFRLPEGTTRPQGPGGYTAPEAVPLVKSTPKRELPTEEKAANEALRKGDACLESGDWEHAADNYLFGLAHASHILKLRVAAIQALIHLNRYDRARQLCQEGIQIATSDQEKNVLRKLLAQLE